AVGSAKNTASLAGSVAISAGSTATLFDSDTSASAATGATTHSSASTSDATETSAHSPASASDPTEATTHSSASTSDTTETSAHSPANAPDSTGAYAASPANASDPTGASTLSSAIPSDSTEVSPQAVKTPSGLNAVQMFDEPLDVYILFNCEPWLDSQSSRSATEALQKAKTVIDINTFSDAQQFPGVRLPLASIYESPGITINAASHWQYRDACTAPTGQSLPGWKILSMLARACKINDLDYSTCDDLSDEVVSHYKEATAADTHGGVRADAQAIPQVSLRRLARPSCFQGDAVQRYAKPLQQTIDSALDHFVWLNPSDAATHKIEHGDHVELHQEGRAL
ncbi:MAG: hypothetical protein K8963_09500, partial [Proteobacteria bacterium]|nr:hypothetical protein [Pseudomonadota bacterium]